jgi:hypothetical protein
MNRPNQTDAAILAAMVEPHIKQLLEHWSPEEVESRVREALRRLQIVAANTGRK